jgi:hypothetical protein
MKIHLDAPIYNHLDRRLSQSTVAIVAAKDTVSEAGVEDIRIEIETAGGEDEDHAWNAVAVVGAEDCWVKGVSARSFGYAGVRVSKAIRITVQGCQATGPVAIRTGSRMYNFAADESAQLVLFTRCHAAGARHSFISNGKSTTSGIVWHRCSMEGGDFEGHRLWSQALLLDNCQELSGSGQAKLMNRGDMGTSHGWGAAHSVIWQFNGQIVCQKPPTAQNYAVSSDGSVRETPYYPGPWGSIEIRPGRLVPESIYEAQLCERLPSIPVQIIARCNSKALTATDPNNQGGLVLTMPEGAGLNCNWYVVGLGNGAVCIRSATGLGFLVVAGASLDEGAPIVLGNYSSIRPDHDQWDLMPSGGTWYTIRSRHSRMVLTVQKQGTLERLVQARPTGDMCQEFALSTVKVN